MPLNVTLISYTPDPEITVAAAAKLCYSPSSIETVRDGLSEEKAASFLNMLSEIGHASPIEHASFTFGIEGVSRSFLAQITRHRIASFSVQSQRYVTENDFEFVTPPEISEDEDANAEFTAAMEACKSSYHTLRELLKKKHIKAFTENGADEKSADRLAEKKAIEDARFVLPNACCTKMIVTLNARSLQNFFNLRCCNRAQWEIKQAADMMLKLCREAAPNLFKNAGPPCLNGPCPEGRMTCGDIKNVRIKYAVNSVENK